MKPRPLMLQEHFMDGYNNRNHPQKNVSPLTSTFNISAFSSLENSGYVFQLTIFIMERALCYWSHKEALLEQALQTILKRCYQLPKHFSSELLQKFFAQGSVAATLDRMFHREQNQNTHITAGQPRQALSTDRTWPSTVQTKPPNGRFLSEAQFACLRLKFPLIFNNRG